MTFAAFIQDVKKKKIMNPRFHLYWETRKNENCIIRLILLTQLCHGARTTFWHFKRAKPEAIFFFGGEPFTERFDSIM